MKVKRVKGHGLRSSISVEAPCIGSWHFKLRPGVEASELTEEFLRTKWLKDHLPVAAKVAIHTLGVGVLATKTLEGQPSHKLVGILEPLDLLEALGSAINKIKSVPTISFPYAVPLGLRESFALRQIDKLDELTTQGKRLHPDFSYYTRAELCQIIGDTGRNPAARVFVHGDLCMPNLLMNHTGELQGFLDVGAAHIGDPDMDVSILSWSVAANMGEASAEYLLNTHGLSVDDRAVQRHRLMYDLSLTGTDRWMWIRSQSLEEQREQTTQDFQRSFMKGNKNDKSPY